MSKTNPSFLNGVPELVVLQMLAQREMYGYELVKAIQARSQEKLSFGEGCIYPVLHDLQERKVVASRRREVGGRARYYYRLTARGQKRLEELTREWQEVVLGVGALLGGAHA